MRTWRLWCHGCDDESVESFDALHDEEGRAVTWFAEHRDHGLGGFMTPVENHADV